MERLIFHISPQWTLLQLPHLPGMGHEVGSTSFHSGGRERRRNGEERKNFHQKEKEERKKREKKKREKKKEREKREKERKRKEKERGKWVFLLGFFHDRQLDKKNSPYCECARTSNDIKTRRQEK